MVASHPLSLSLVHHWSCRHTAPVHPSVYPPPQLVTPVRHPIFAALPPPQLARHQNCLLPLHVVALETRTLLPIAIHADRDHTPVHLRSIVALCQPTTAHPPIHPPVSTPVHHMQCHRSPQLQLPPASHPPIASHACCELKNRTRPNPRTLPSGYSGISARSTGPTVEKSSLRLFQCVSSGSCQHSVTRGQLAWR